MIPSLLPNGSGLLEIRNSDGTLQYVYGMMSPLCKLPPTAQKFRGYTFNLSENGIGIEGSRGSPPKFNIQVTLYTGDNTLKIEGVVRWLHLSNPEKWFMGIEVTCRTDKIKEIYTYLNSICDFDL